MQMQEVSRRSRGGEGELGQCALCSSTACLPHEANRQDLGGREAAASSGTKTRVMVPHFIRGGEAAKQSAGNVGTGWQTANLQFADSGTDHQ